MYRFKAEKAILFLSYSNPCECIFVTSLHLQNKMQTPRPHVKAFHNQILLPFKPHLQPLFSPLSHVLSTFKIRLFRYILLCCASVTLNKPFCLAKSLSFLPSKLLILQEPAQMSPALRSSCSARQSKCLSASYLYLLCCLLFCTVIMSTPVTLPRLCAPKSGDCDALIFVSKPGNGTYPLLCVQ